MERMRLNHWAAVLHGAHHSDAEQQGLITDTILQCKLALGDKLTAMLLILVGLQQQ